MFRVLSPSGLLGGELHLDSGSLRDAYTLSLERFDLQYTFLTTERYLGEQVTIHSAQRQRHPDIVSLPERDQELQVSMRAHNEAGDNLILLSKDRLDSLYRDVFEDALGYIHAQDGVPDPIQGPIDDEWWDDFFTGDWFENLREDEEARTEVEGFLREVFVDIGEVVSDEEAATEVFADYVIKHLDESYRPCVLLEDDLGGPDGHPGRLVKYEVQGDVALSWWKRVTEAVLGFVPLQVDFGYETECSSYLRLKSPEGMVFNHHVRAPPNCTRFHPGRQQLQAYYTKEDAQALATGVELGDGGDEQEGDQDAGSQAGREGVLEGVDEAEMRGRLSQSASTRVIVSALFLLVSVAPILFAWGGGGAADLSFGEAWADLAPPWSEPAVQQVELGDVETTVQMGLPLAILLVALAWDRRPVRPFAVTQLILALLVTVAWVVGVRSVAVAQAATGVGLALAVYNLLEATLFIVPMSTRGWYDWCWN